VMSSLVDQKQKHSEFINITHFNSFFLSTPQFSKKKKIFCLLKEKRISRKNWQKHQSDQTYFFMYFERLDNVPPAPTVLSKLF